jgi:hypothetical protein
MNALDMKTQRTKLTTDYMDFADINSAIFVNFAAPAEIEGHHIDPQKNHGWDSANAIEVRCIHPILKSVSGHAQKFENSEVCR